MKIRTIFPLLLGFALTPVCAQTSATLDGLDNYVKHTMTQWQVPGLAVAIVKDGKVVLARGYGVRELGEPDKVDADTVFGIASNSKAFTVAAIGTLVSGNKLDWDARVVDHVKNFRLSSPSSHRWDCPITAEITTTISMPTLA